MELALAIALAIVSVAAVSAWARRNEERARANRLSDEVTALRRASSGQRIVESDPGSTPGVSALPSSPEPGPPEPQPEELPEDVRRLASAAQTALAAIEARARPGSTLPVETLRQEAIALLAALERVDLALSPLADRATVLVPERAGPERRALPPEPAPTDVAPAATGLRGTEDLADTAARLKDDLRSVARSTERLQEAAAAASEALAAVARGAEAIAPMAGALSSVANRVNLLALNLAVLVSPKAGSANVEEAGAELRSIFEEARRLSRDVGALAQRVAAAARAAADRSGDVAAALADDRARVERGLADMGTLDDLADRLRAAFESVRRVARESDEARARFHAELAVALAQADALAVDVSSDRRAVAAFAADLRGTCALLTEVRLMSERAVRNLLAVAETASQERRSSAAEAQALEGLREALRRLAGG